VPARPLLGRWMNVDPLAEMYAPVSGYSLVLNNPISLIDPSGMSVENWIQREDGNVGFDPSIKNQSQAESKYGKNALDLGSDITISDSQTGSQYYGGANGDISQLLGTADVVATAPSWKVHQEFEINVSYGAQVGIQGKLGGAELGGHLNVANIELFSAKEELHGFNGEGANLTLNYVGKDGLTKVTQSAEIGLGVVNGSFDHSFNSYNRGTRDIEDKYGFGASYGPFGGKRETNITSGQSSYETGIGLDARLGLGIKIDFKMVLKKE
jgi:hypothetical protein